MLTPSDIMERSCTIWHSCLECDSNVWMTDEELQDHIAKAHVHEIYHGTLHKKYQTHYDYVLHVRACPTCFTVFPFEENLYSHISTMNCKHPLACNRCGEMCLNMADKFKGHRCVTGNTDSRTL